jgi:hypothetical protein
MPVQPRTAVVEDLEARRAQLNDGKCLDQIGVRLPHFLAMEIRQLAKDMGTSASDWMMRAAIEKIVSDETEAAAREMLRDAKATKPAGISEALHEEIIRAAIDKLRKK